MKSRLVAAGLIVAVALAGACSDDDDDGAQASSTTTAPVGTTATTAPAPIDLTLGGYGPLRLGISLDDARQTGFLGETTAGCELAGPEELSAPLALPPVDGYATFSMGTLSGITVRAGATTPEGIGPGSTVEEVKQAYTGDGYSVIEDPTTEEVFGVLTVNVRRNDQPVYGMDADPATRKIGTVSIPELRFCD